MSVINEVTKLFRWELFNFIKFQQFLEKNKAFATASAIVIATQLSVLATSFVENIILPIFNRDINEDGVPDIHNFENIEIDIFGIKIKMGKFAVAILRFLIIIYIVFLVSVFYDYHDDIVKYDD